MAAFAAIQQAIEVIQAGHLAEGARLLRYALRDDSVQGELRATALTWLAEAVESDDEKIQCYQQALQADPDYAPARQRLAQLMQPAPPPPPPPTIPESQPPPPAPVYEPPHSTPAQPAQPASYPSFSDTPPQSSQRYNAVGVIANDQRRGSGFFITDNGLIATTRTVTGAQEHLMVELEPGAQMPGRVVRSFPEMDVALVYVEQAVSDLLPFSPFADIPANTAITITPWQQPPVNGLRRETGRTLAPHLFPTDITHNSDGGGAPVFDERQALVGMITRNISSSSAHVYGVHLAAIRRCVDTFLLEMRANGQRMYCANCGFASAVAASGGYYCEACGAIMPHAQNQSRVFSATMTRYYHENHPVACSVCGAQAGFNEGRCLRCGQAGEV